MKMLITGVAFIVCGLTISCKSNPIEFSEVMGTWEVIKRWGKGPMTGSIVFHGDGTFQTIKLPWGSITGQEKHLVAFESINGYWEIETKNGEKVVCLRCDRAISTGQDYMTWITPEQRSGKWTFRRYIGDPDLMDIIEFHKR